MTTRTMLLVLLGLVLGSFGCGDDDGGGGPGNGAIQLGNCPAFSACGGELDGAWTLDGLCIDDDMPFDTTECPGLTVVNTGGDVSGTLTFADGTLTSSVTSSITATLGIPSSCTMGLSCAMIQGALAMSEGLDTATCSSSAGGGCTCTVGVLNSAMSSTTYTVDGDVVTTGDGDRFEYCVSGGTLRYSELDQETPTIFSLVR